MKTFLRLLLMLILIPTVVTLATEENEPSPLPLIIDTDMAVDDWLAILYLSQHPDVELLAVSITGAGEAHCDPGLKNTLDLLELANQPEVPVACGRETPLMGSNSFPSWLRDRVDSMAGLRLPENHNPSFDGTAVDLLITTIQEAAEPITLLTLGPLTNVAEALETEPSLIDNIQMIYIMGGAVDVPGNAGFIDNRNRVAEANIYVDPHAANLVFVSGVPITLVPLDATNDAQVTIGFLQKLEEDRTTPQADFVYQALEQSLDFIASGGYYFWDPLAAAIMMQEDLATFEERTLVVQEEVGSENGQTMEADDGSPIRVAVSADSDRFETQYLDVLNERYISEAP